MKPIYQLNIKKIKGLFIIIFLIIFINNSLAQNIGNEPYDNTYKFASNSIKSTNGKFYAYIVLLFNENPHFINLIQKDSIPLHMLGNEGFHIKAYKNYLNTITDYKLYKLAHTLLLLYLDPKKFEDDKLRDIENTLSNNNIILRFSKDKNAGIDRITLDYCIYGKKEPISVKHPFIEIKEKIYNIQPYIYYDELLTSNSTFYFNMIYINPDEVNNDYIIAKKVLNNENVSTMSFVGSPVSENIKYCLQRAFKYSSSIKGEIWRMFVIHELTHKLLNNYYNNFDQVAGEELSLCSTIYSNVFLGLSVMYSYLNYSSLNPHRVAAMNYVRFIAKKSGKNEIINNPGMIKLIPHSDLKAWTKEHFETNYKIQKAE